MQLLTRGRHFGVLRFKIFCFRQAEQFMALVGLSFCYFTWTCGVLCPRAIWALASSLYSSAILNVFGVSMIEATLRGCFNHVSITIRGMHCLM